MKPEVSVSTKWVYERLDYTKKPDGLDIDGIVSGIRNANLDEMISHMGNILETVTIPGIPDRSRIQSAAYGERRQNRYDERQRNERIRDILIEQKT